MAVSIEPFSPETQHALQEFFQQHDVVPREIVAWKYFDPTIISERPRGLACWQNGRIGGVLGLLPFTVLINGQALPTAWSCDWYRDPSLPGPLGIMLFQEALKFYPLLYSLGGNAQTQSIMPRLAQHTSRQAAIELHKPIRMGGALRALARVAHKRLPERIPVIDRIPLRLLSNKREAKSDLRLSNDLLPDLRSLLTSGHGDDPCPLYDLPRLEWQLDRCPAVSSGICSVAAGTPAGVGVLFWCPAGDNRFWRVAILGNRNEEHSLLAALRTVLDHVQRAGAWTVSALISRLDLSLLSLFRRMGFVTGQRRPLFILNRMPGIAAEDLHGLSYLDTDYSYRFTSVRNY